MNSCIMRYKMVLACVLVCEFEPMAVGHGRKVPDKHIWLLFRIIPLNTEKSFVPSTSSSTCWDHDITYKFSVVSVSFYGLV